MKIIFVIFFIVCGHAAVLDIKRVNKRPLNGDAIIHQLFEMLKYYISNGDTDKNLPILDPLEIEDGYAEIYLPSKILSLQAGFQKGVFSGLGQFQLERAKFMKEQVAVNLTITFPLITIKSDFYQLEGDIFGAVPISGQGKFDLEIEKFTFKGMFFLKQSEDGKSILIDSIIKPEFNIKQINSKTDIDGNVDAILNAMIGDLMAGYLNRFNKYIAKTYISFVIDNLNPFLNKFESWRLLAPVL